MRQQQVKQQGTGDESKQYIGGNGHGRRRGKCLVDGERQHQHAQRPRPPDEIAGERAGGEVVDCDQAAPRGIGRKHAQRDSAAERGDHNPGNESIRDLNHAHFGCLEQRDRQERRGERKAEENAERGKRLGKPAGRAGCDR